jgi:hypothetical protein
VRVLLPMRDDDDAEDEAEAALRERENLATRASRRRRCCATCSRARSTSAPPRTTRSPRATTTRSPACASTARCRPAVRRRRPPPPPRPAPILARGPALACSGSLPPGLAPIWYGAAPEHRHDILITPPLTLTVPSPEGTRAVTLLGQSEPLSLVEGVRVAVSLVMGQRQYLERDRLGAWLSHLVLAAAAPAPTARS